MAVFKQRRGTSAALAAANETPAAGQIVWETDTNRIKIGDGATSWNSLQYLNNEIVIGDVVGLQVALDGKATASHTHTFSGVVGLQAALDGKASTTHTHTAASITGLGTVVSLNIPATGNATTTQVVIGSDTRLIDQRVPADGSVTFSKLSSTLKIDAGVVA